MAGNQNEELVFAALADQVRRQILDTLASHGESNAGFIADQIASVGRTTVSTHLKALRTSGVVVERRDGRHRYYSIDPAGPANDALQFLQGVLERALSTPDGDHVAHAGVVGADTEAAPTRRRA